MGKLWNIAVVGATGAVGGQVIECLDEREFPVGTVKFLASARSAGEIPEFRGKPVVVEELAHDSFTGVDIAFFAASGECAREFCPSAARAGAVCIDSSGAWRSDPDVPLVVPEVNADALAGYSRKGIVASPDGVAIQLAVALKPLHAAAGIKRVVVSTYQSVSGSGKQAIDELHAQVVALLNGRPSEPVVYPHRIAFNCLPVTGTFTAGGYIVEETALGGELRKVLAAEIRVTATAVRVPVFYGDSAAVNIETERNLSAADARELLAAAPGCLLVDDPAQGDYPMAIDAAGQDQVLVGRVRADDSVDNGLNLWVASDNIRKGGATNAVQIAELLIGKYLK
jgi:aspartate-semialdehyde dehydrogenase